MHRISPQIGHSRPARQFHRLSTMSLDSPPAFLAADFIGSTDPRRLQVHRPPGQRDVPYVPTDEPVVAAMMDIAGVGPGDVFYDLGCGDGRLVLAAAARGARAIGVDIDLQRMHECYENRKRTGIRADFVRASFFDVDLHDATVVALYLLPSINVKLRPKLLWEMRPGTRIIANYFSMGDWAADENRNVCQRLLHKWIVPAWVEGRWRCIVNSPSARQHILLDLHRRYQQVWGTAHVGRREVPISGAKLAGDELTFAVGRFAFDRPVMRFQCRVSGNQMRGISWEPDRDGPIIKWCGTRR